MRNLFLRSAALIAIGVSVAAHAADMPVKAPPFLPEPPYNWSGAYVGANLGGAWTSGSLNIPNNNLYGGLTEFIAGVQAGYNFQVGHFLFGVEGDFDGATFGHPFDFERLDRERFLATMIASYSGNARPLIDELNILLMA